MLKHFFKKKKKKQDNQTAFAGSEKKIMLHTFQYYFKAWQTKINQINHTLI